MRFERCTVVGPHGRRPDPRAEAAAADLASAGLRVTRANCAQLENDHTMRAEMRGTLLVSTLDPVVVAPLAAELDAPLLDLRDIDDLTGLADRLRAVQLDEETLLLVRLDRRPPRRLLGDCVVAPVDDGTLGVTIGGGAKQLTTPVLRAVTKDPYGVAGADRCRYDGPATTIGLCWGLDQPIADRVVPADARVTIRTDPPDRQVTVRGDHDRFQAVAHQVQIGPNPQFVRARLL